MTDPETDVSVKPPISVRKRLFVGGATLVLVLAALGIGSNVLQNSKNTGVLKRAMADLDKSDPGWRLDEIEAARPVIPDDQNSAVVVVRAHGLLGRRALINEKLPKLNELYKPELLDAERLEIVAEELKSNEAAVAEARKLADMPLGRHRLTYARNPFLTLLPDQQKIRGVCGILQLDAFYLAQTGKPAESLRSCRAIFNGSRSLDDEAILISQLIRIACDAIAAAEVERTLALGECPDKDLASLAQLVGDEEAHQGFRIALRGERAGMHAFFNGVSDGSLSVAELMDGPTSALVIREKYFSWSLRSLARREHPRMLALMNRAIETTYLPLHEQPTAQAEFEKDVKKLRGNDSLLDKLTLSESLLMQVFPAIMKVAEAHRRKTAQLRCLSVLVAVERYRMQKGAWPGRLEDVPATLLKSVPLDPFDGKPLRYKKLADGVVVYSVGVDGRDDGGNLQIDPRTGRQRDLGFRLWDVKYRRQPPKLKLPPGEVPGPPGAKE